MAGWTVENSVGQGEELDTVRLGYLRQNERDRNTDHVLHHQSQVRGYPKTGS